MPVAQQVKVVNPSNGVVVITPDPDSPRSYLRFEAKGDELGGDVQYLSREKAQSPDFMKAVQRGLLVVEGLDSDDPLYNLLRARRTRKKDGTKPLTVQNVEFDEAQDYKAVTTEIPVVIDPLARV